MRNNVVVDATHENPFSFAKEFLRSFTERYAILGRAPLYMLGDHGMCGGPMLFWDRLTMELRMDLYIKASRAIELWGELRSDHSISSSSHPEKQCLSHQHTRRADFLPSSLHACDQAVWHYLLFQMHSVRNHPPPSCVKNRFSPFCILRLLSSIFRLYIFFPLKHIYVYQDVHIFYLLVVKE